MAGVIMHARGPGAPVLGPSELAVMLHRPLAALLPPGSGSPVGGLVLLDADDNLSEDALEVACEYTEALFDDGCDPATGWLPRWAWQQAEKVERDTFQALVLAGDQRAYTASRRFVVERPAGDAKGLLAERSTDRRFAGARPVADLGPIPRDRRLRYGPGGSDSCWWACPVCRWPMLVRPPVVACSYGPHDARFRMLDRPGGPPDLAATAARDRAAPRPNPTESAVCVDPAVWRFVTVPGLPEVALEKLQNRFPGVAVQLWPLKDTYDALVTTPAGHRMSVDVKDHADAQTIVERPPAAEHVVIPDHRRGQLQTLRRQLTGHSVWTMTGFGREVGTRVRGEVRP